VLPLLGLAGLAYGLAARELRRATGLY